MVQGGIPFGPSNKETKHKVEGNSERNGLEPRILLLYLQYFVENFIAFPSSVIPRNSRIKIVGLREYFTAYSATSIDLTER